MSISIVSFLPRIFGRNRDFPKDSVWGEITFHSAKGERAFEAFDLLRGSLIFDNF